MTFIKQRQENTKSRPEGGCINQNQKTLSPGETAYKPALLSSKKAKKKIWRCQRLKKQTKLNARGKSKKRTTEIDSIYKLNP